MTRVGPIFGVAHNELGDGFWMVKFNLGPHDDGSGDGRRAIGIVEDGVFHGGCYVVLLSDFMGQSEFTPTMLDGSLYEAELRAAITAWQQATPTERTTWGRIKGDWKGE